jgi:hypothetical protein
MKQQVVITNDYILYLENLDGNVFIHCDCFKWNKTVKKQLKEDVDKVVAFLGKPILAVHNPEDKKHFKFLTMMGFTYFGNIKSNELFIRRQ